jgi:hypothetical protein
LQAKRALIASYWVVFTNWLCEFILHYLL